MTAIGQLPEDKPTPNAAPTAPQIAMKLARALGDTACTVGHRPRSGYIHA
jgi:hypothetical protein